MRPSMCEYGSDLLATADGARDLAGATHASAVNGASCAFRPIETARAPAQAEEAWGVSDEPRYAVAKHLE